MQTEKRNAAVDFWRGFVLISIFINHIPGNVLGYVTPRNVAFSDAAEAFVFLSGVSVSMAYGARIAGAPGRTAATLWRRAGKLYLAHVVLTLVGLALFGLAYEATRNLAFLIDDGRDVALIEPVVGLAGVLSLGHQIGHYNILPLYVLLLVAAPAFLLAATRSPLGMLLASVGIYAAARWFALALPSWPTPEGGFFFNPFAWQLVFAFGLYAGSWMRARSIPLVGPAYAVAFAVVLVSAVLNSNVFGLLPGLVDAAGLYLDWDKTWLGTVRLLNFLSLAYVLYHSPITAALRATPVFAPVALLGRHSLEVFCAGTLLSSIGLILTETLPRSILFDVAYVAIGIVLLHQLARRLECSDQATRSSATAGAPGSAPASARS
ncbi:OpgC family protein [Prosthecomicrobium sp. N25]|uniref:OpgC family protein n=1 Tax=Prosthecomicrobium sp. N25 TaxID=3129254 RepID=UPI003076F241